MYAIWTSCIDLQAFNGVLSANTSLEDSPSLYRTSMAGFAARAIAKVTKMLLRCYFHMIVYMFLLIIWSCDSKNILMRINVLVFWNHWCYCSDAHNSTTSLFLEGRDNTERSGNHIWPRGSPPNYASGSASSCGNNRRGKICTQTSFKLCIFTGSTAFLLLVPDVSAVQKSIYYITAFQLPLFYVALQDKLYSLFSESKLTVTSLIPAELRSHESITEITESKVN